MDVHEVILHEDSPRGLGLQQVLPHDCMTNSQGHSTFGQCPTKCMDLILVAEGGRLPKWARNQRLLQVITEGLAVGRSHAAGDLLEPWRLLIQGLRKICQAVRPAVQIQYECRDAAEVNVHHSLRTIQLQLCLLDFLKTGRSGFHNLRRARMLQQRGWFCDIACAFLPSGLRFASYL